MVGRAVPETGVVPPGVDEGVGAGEGVELDPVEVEAGAPDAGA